MTKTIAVCNQKGGCGKSTTAQALAAGLTQRGYRVLLVDLDAQGNTSFSLGANRAGATSLGVLLGEVKAAEAIQKTPYCDIIPANKSLAAAEATITDVGKEYRLREAIEELEDNYDYVVIDTPPSLGILSINALTACDTVVIPAQADIYSLQGIADLVETIKPVKKYCNQKLQIAGILFTRHNSRYAFTKELSDYAEGIAANLKTKVFKATIREAVAVRSAQAAQKSIFEYDPKSKVANDYSEFIDELLEGGKQ